MAEWDVRFLFKPGDKVLLKQWLTGKLKVKATGPHVFLRYTGRRQVTALIGEVGGRQLHVSAANLLPMRPE